MKYTLALLLVANMALAQGVVVYKKSNGEIQERKVPVVLFDADNSTKILGTNWITTLQKWQPKETTTSKTRVFGAQVWKGDDKAVGVDWTVYDLGDYASKLTEDPTNITELAGFVARDCLTATDPQLGKSVTRRKYENRYFKLVKSILQLANDPRKDQVPIPKLTFDELDAILDGLYEVPASNKQATKLAMKRLSVDSALLRYDVMWYDTAVWHSEVE